MPQTDAVLAKLMEKFGVSATEIWPIMLKYVVTDWWIQTILWGVLLIISLIGIVWVFKTGDSWKLDLAPVRVGLLLFGAFALIFFLVQMSTFSTIWFPERAALAELARLIK